MKFRSKFAEASENAFAEPSEVNSVKHQRSFGGEFGEASERVRRSFGGEFGEASEVSSAKLRR